VSLISIPTSRLGGATFMRIPRPPSRRSARPTSWRRACKSSASRSIVGSRAGDRAIAIRADMDALDVSEKNGFHHHSTHPGKMHACGHDGHTTMLLGAARYLAETRNFAGTVHFIFQPAEENEAGGKVMVEQGLFEQFPVEAVYGMHNWPGMPVGQFAVRSGPLLAS